MATFRKTTKVIRITGDAGEVNTQRLLLSSKVVQITGIKVHPLNTNSTNQNSPSAYNNNTYSNGYS